MHSEDLPTIEILNEIVTLAKSANKKTDINQIINKLDMTRLIPPFNESQDAQIKEILNTITKFIPKMTKIEFREMVRILGVSNLKIYNLPEPFKSVMTNYIQDHMNDFDIRDLTSIAYGCALMDFSNPSDISPLLIASIKEKFNEAEDIHEYDVTMLNYLQFDYGFTLEGKNTNKLNEIKSTEIISYEHSKIHSILKNKFKEEDLRQEYPVTHFIKVDEALPFFKVAIEIDGPHHAMRKNTDDMRDRILLNSGWAVIRIGENPPAIDIDSAISLIQNHLIGHESEIITSIIIEHPKGMDNTNVTIIDADIKYEERSLSPSMMSTEENEIESDSDAESDFYGHLSPLEQSFNNFWDTGKFYDHGISHHKRQAYILYEIFSKDVLSPDLANSMMNLLNNLQKALNDNDLFEIFCDTFFDTEITNSHEYHIALKRAVVSLSKIIALDIDSKKDWICIFGASLDSLKDPKAIKLFDMLVCIFEGLDKIGAFESKCLAPLMKKIGKEKNMNIQLIATLNFLLSPSRDTIKSVEAKTVESIAILQKIPYFAANPELLIKLLVNEQYKEIMNGLIQLHKNNYKMDDVVNKIFATGNPLGYYSNLKSQLMDMYQSKKNMSTEINAMQASRPATSPASSVNNTLEEESSPESTSNTSPTRPRNKSR